MSGWLSPDSERPHPRGWKTLHQGTGAIISVSAERKMRNKRDGGPYHRQTRHHGSWRVCLERPSQTQHRHWLRSWRSPRQRVTLPPVPIVPLPRSELVVAREGGRSYCLRGCMLGVGLRACVHRRARCVRVQNL